MARFSLLCLALFALGLPATTAQPAGSNSAAAPATKTAAPAAAATAPSTASKPLFTPRPWSPTRDYYAGDVVICEDGKPWKALFWSKGSPSCVPPKTLTETQLAEWPFAPANQADLDKAAEEYNAHATKTDSGVWTGTGTFTDTNTPYIETPEPTYVLTGDRGYGPIPATGTYMKNGWMCFEWGNVDGEFAQYLYLALQPFADSHPLPLFPTIGYTFPIRVVEGAPGQPSGGLPACMATADRKSCKWVSPWFGPLGIPAWTSQYGDYSRCQKLVDEANDTTPYIACGDQYKELYTWDGFDETDPESWCAAAALALDIRPDKLRRHMDSGPVNTTFENAAGRKPNYPSKEIRPAPRPEDELIAECTRWGWGCASCDEIRYQCNDGIQPSCDMLSQIPAGCTGNGVRDKSLEWYLDQVGAYPYSRYTQTKDRPKTTAIPVPTPTPTPTANSTPATTASATGTPILVENGTTRLPGGLASKVTQTATPVPGSAGKLAAGVIAAVGAGVAAAAML